MFISNPLSVMGTSTAILLACAVGASALSIQVDDGVGTVQVDDNDPNDANNVIGEIDYDQSGLGPVLPGGIWDIAIALATSKPIIGNPDLAQLELDVEAGNNQQPGTLTVRASDQNFSLGGQTPWLTFFAVDAIIEPDVVVEYEAWYDPGNSLFMKSVLIDDPVAFLNAANPFEAFSQTIFGDTLGAGGPFSLTLETRITHNVTNAFTQAGSRVGASPIPIPASLPLLLVSLGLTGFFLKRRRA